MVTQSMLIHMGGNRETLALCTLFVDLIIIDKWHYNALLFDKLFTLDPNLRL